MKYKIELSDGKQIEINTKQIHDNNNICNIVYIESLPKDQIKTIGEQIIKALNKRNITNVLVVPRTNNNITIKEIKVIDNK